MGEGLENDILLHENFELYLKVLNLFDPKTIDLDWQIYTHSYRLYRSGIW